MSDPKTAHLTLHQAADALNASTTHVKGLLDKGSSPTTARAPTCASTASPYSPTRRATTRNAKPYSTSSRAKPRNKATATSPGRGVSSRASRAPAILSLTSWGYSSPGPVR